MTRLVVEWRHLAVEGETCERCGSTGANLRAVVAELAPVLGVRGIVLELREELLSPEDIARSNEVLVGGTPVEELVGGRAATTECPSCSTLVGAPCACRTIRVGDDEFEELPESLIAAAILNAADRL